MLSTIVLAAVRRICYGTEKRQWKLNAMEALEHKDGDIHEELPIAKATVSQHLSALKEAGLIQGEIETPKEKYCINRENWMLAQLLFKEFFGQSISKGEDCGCKK